MTIKDGTAGNDNLVGTAGADTLNGLGGSDILNGLAGHDILNGDAVTGPQGSDRLIGGSGNDTLNGRGGDDRLIGGTGNDIINGGTGRDTADYRNTIDGQSVIGATAGVTVNLNLTGAQNTGGAGIDTLISIENVTGTNFTDVLTGNGGNNVLSGQGGNDRLLGGAGNDTLNGGSGNDLLNGGTGIDTAFYIGATAGVTVTLPGTLPGELIGKSTGGSGVDTLVSIENVVGSSFNDTLSGNLGSPSPCMLDGGLGNDTLLASSGILNGGAGNDILTSYSIGDSMVLNGGDGNDTLRSGDATEILNGGAGDDILIAGGDYGMAVMNGGDGNDKFSGNTQGINVHNGGAGADAMFAGFAAEDTFDYNSVSDSPAGTGRDVIHEFDKREFDPNFGPHDQIDLRDIDANTLVSGNQAFTWKGATPGGAGTLWYTEGNLYGNVDADAAPEFQIQLVGVPTLTVGGTGADILL